MEFNFQEVNLNNQKENIKPSPVPESWLPGKSYGKDGKVTLNYSQKDLREAEVELRNASTPAREEYLKKKILEIEKHLESVKLNELSEVEM